MNSIADIGAMLKDPEFQARFEDSVSGAARRHHSFIAYLDDQGRMVREYPATEEVFQTSADRKTLILLSIGGISVEANAPIVVEATPYRFVPATAP